MFIVIVFPGIGGFCVQSESRKNTLFLKGLVMVRICREVCVRPEGEVENPYERMTRKNLSKVRRLYRLVIFPQKGGLWYKKMGRICRGQHVWRLCPDGG